MVRAMFAVASCHQPAVIFIDEIDSLLTQRSDTENEACRRVKTEFLVQWDGVGTTSEDRILLIGATNRPQELDEAARRRLVKRVEAPSAALCSLFFAGLYIPLPDAEARASLVMKLLARAESHTIGNAELQEITLSSKGASKPNKVVGFE